MKPLRACGAASQSHSMQPSATPWPEPGRSASARTLREHLLFWACYVGAGSLAWSASFAAGLPFRDGWPSAVRVIGTLVVADLLQAGVKRWERAKAAESLPGGADATRGRVLRTAWARTPGERGNAAMVATFVGAAVLSLAIGRSNSGVLVGGAGVLFGLLWIVRHVWLGGIEVRWEPGSIRSGCRAVFDVATTEGASRLVGARFLLRCVGPDRSSVRRRPDPVGLRVRSLWQSEVCAGEKEAPGPGEFMRVVFDVPEEALPTGSSAARPVVWELIVHGRSTWGRLTEVFVVPMGAATSA